MMAMASRMCQTLVVRGSASNAGVHMTGFMDEDIVKEILILMIPILCLLAMVGCRAAPGAECMIVAHRGASQDAPENTLAAFRLGFEQGADRIEGDFRMTSDGHIIAMHDRTLSRTTGDPRETADVPLGGIRSLGAGDWGPWKGGEFRNEGVPTLAEVLAIVPEDRGILVEVKDSDRIVPVLIRELERSGLDRDRVAVIAFDREVVATMKRASPKWKAMWLTSFSRRNGTWSPTVDEVIEIAKSIGADGVDVEADPAVVDRTFVERVRSAGLELHVWTVNDPQLALVLREIGVDSITTDRPAVIRKAIVR